MNQLFALGPEGVLAELASRRAMIEVSTPRRRRRRIRRAVR
jgi:hypothetical protein